MPQQRIVYTYHAKRRMAQRRITGEQVGETLFKPDKPYISGSEGDEEIAIRRYGNREIRTVFEEQ